MSTSKTWPGGGTGATPASYSIPAAGELNWAALSNFLIALADGAQCTTFQKFAVRKATTTPVTVATSDCIIVTDMAVASAVTVNLPAGANKQVFYIIDGKGDADTYNVTINRAGSDTIAGSTSLVMSGAREGCGLIYNSSDTDFKIFNRFNRSVTSGITGVLPVANGGTNSSTALNNNRVIQSSAGAIIEAAAITPSRALVSDSNGIPTHATTTTTQVNYLSAATGTTGTTSTNVVFSTSPTLITPALGTPTALVLTSATGLPLTSGVTGILPVANGGTNSSTSLNSNRNIVSSGGTIVESAAITASRALVSDSNGLPTHATTTTTQVNYLSAATGTTGTTSTNVVFSTSPTLVTPVLGAATATSLNGLTITSSTGVLTITNGKTLAVSNSLTFTGTDGNSFAFPSGSDSVVTLTATQALTNKDFQGGTASNSLRITVPSNTLSALTALTRKEGTIVYATDTDQLLADDGVSLNAIGSGQGEKNYITNSNNATNWTASGAGITVATSITAAELPREFTTKSGIKITGASGSTAYAYYRFTIDDADWSRKCKIKFDIKPVSGYVASDMKVDLYSNTASNYGGTSTRVVTSSDASSICAIPNLTGQFDTYVDMPSSSAPYMELRIGLNATSTQAIVISDVIVGPGVGSRGAAIQEWISFTPTGSWSANTTYTGRYRRVGDTLDMDVKVACSGAPTSAGLTINLPTGLTIDTTKLSDTSTSGGNHLSGLVGILDSGVTTYVGEITYTSTTAINIAVVKTDGTYGTDANVTQALPMTFGASDAVTVRCSLPIAEWAGSGTINVSQNDVEYVYNTAGTTAAGGSDTTSFGYGPVGAATGAISSATTTASNTSMRVRFQTPISSSDIITLEVTDDTGNSSSDWFPVGSYGQIVQNCAQGTARYGAGLLPVSGSSTDIDVIFGNAGGRTTNTSYAAAGEAWNTRNTRWRVKKAKGGQAVGFGTADRTAQTLGLVKLPNSILRINTAAGYGSGSTKIRRFSVTEINTGSAISYPGDSSTLGAVITINISGLYYIAFTDSSTDGAQTNIGASVNSAQLTTDVETITSTTRLFYVNTRAGNPQAPFTMASTVVYLTAGDIVRPHTNGANGYATDVRTVFHVAHIGG